MNVFVFYGDSDSEHRFNMTNLHFFLNSNAQQICSDPRGKNPSPSKKREKKKIKHVGIMKPLHEFFAMFDIDGNALIEPADVRKSFRRADNRARGYLNKHEMNGTSKILQELCYQSMII